MKNSRTWFNRRRKERQVLQETSRQIKKAVDSILAINPAVASTEKNELRYQLISTNEMRTETAELATQAAKFRAAIKCIVHDVRTPIASLAMLADEKGAVPEAARVILHDATNDISEMTEGLLKEWCGEDSQRGDGVDELGASERQLDGGVAVTRVC